MDTLRTQMELLAPAGGPEQLDYAIRYGADAVYLAADKFGMRAKATNFTFEQLKSAVQRAHAAGTKVHLTCNIAFHEHQLAELPAFLEQAEDVGVDALIIGDLGAFSLARRYAPRTEIHVSTQASVCNSEAAKMWHSLGAKRIVAAREMSLADLARMRQEMPSDLELEAFVHGAMCMAYSGRCLVSDFMTRDRSGIHGNCAQSCRWEFNITEPRRKDLYFPVKEDENGSYLLNAEDLCMLEHLADLREAGIDSIKIEGRNKKAYYVACVVNAYRQVLDGARPEAFLRELDCVSHRPYSTGFYYGMAHQTSEQLTYLRNTDWAGQVISCQPLSDGRYQVEFRCRSKFALAGEFELLRPHKPVQPLQMSDLLHIPDSRYDIPQPRTPKDWEPAHREPYAVDEANHPGERYFAVISEPAEPFDIIRVLR